jgi:hypothetical protein
MTLDGWSTGQALAVYVGVLVGVFVLAVVVSWVERRSQHGRRDQ